MISEGCAEPLEEGEHVQQLVQIGCSAMQSQSAALRGAGLYAIGQFAEYLAEAMADFAADSLKLVLKLLEQPTGELGKHSQLERALNCIEQLMDPLNEEEFEAALPALLQNMCRFIQEPHNDYYQEPVFDF